MMERAYKTKNDEVFCVCDASVSYIKENAELVEMT